METKHPNCSEPTSTHTRLTTNTIDRECEYYWPVSWPKFDFLASFQFHFFSRPLSINIEISLTFGYINLLLQHGLSRKKAYPNSFYNILTPMPNACYILHLHLIYSLKLKVRNNIMCCFHKSLSKSDCILQKYFLSPDEREYQCWGSQ